MDLRCFGHCGWPADPAERRALYSQHDVQGTRPAGSGFAVSWTNWITEADNEDVLTRVFDTWVHRLAQKAS